MKFEEFNLKKDLQKAIDAAGLPTQVKSNQKQFHFFSKGKI